MKKYFKFSSLIPYLIITILLSLPSFSYSQIIDNNNHYESFKPFLDCLSQHQISSESEFAYSPNNKSYQRILNSTLMNPRTFLYPLNPNYHNPNLILTPVNADQVQSTVICARENKVEIRIRSGGHDSEGLSYLSPAKIFVVLDLGNLRKVKVNAGEKTAWVDSGATLGEVYLAVAEKSNDRLAFPAGISYTVGAGGHFSGGGFGVLQRKYGLAADNIVDACIVDFAGRILNAESMGKDVFWAIRGGGAASFGVVLSWKIKLVDVPSRVTMFSVVRDLSDKKTKKLVHRWQYIAPELPEELTVFVRAMKPNSTALTATFSSVFLGSCEEVFRVMRKRFPELGFDRRDCAEMKWIDTVVLMNNFPVGSSPKVLLDRTRPQGRPMSFIAKSDFVEEPISEKVLERLWETLNEDDDGVPYILLAPYGGKMAKISESGIPFPHRAMNIYMLSYYSIWDEIGDSEANKRHLNWTRSVYGYMTPYVSKNPRGAYLNFRDLDLGKNNDYGPTSFQQASMWARSYFRGNFERLIMAKRKADPTNFFKNEQSIISLLEEIDWATQ